jgi:hypothetical protein
MRVYLDADRISSVSGVAVYLRHWKTVAAD